MPRGYTASPARVALVDLLGIIVLNDLLWRALSKADIPAVKELSYLLRTDGKRPDGVTQLP